MNKYTVSFRYVKANAIQIAYDLYYSIDVIRQLEKAETTNELTRIMRAARLANDD